MGMEQLIDKSKHLIFERDTYQANIKALQQDMKDKKRIVLFVGAGINLGGNNDIDISWNGLLNMMLKDALSILTAEKRYTIQERERLEELVRGLKKNNSFGKHCMALLKESLPHWFELPLSSPFWVKIIFIPSGINCIDTVTKIRCVTLFLNIIAMGREPKKVIHP